MYDIVKRLYAANEQSLSFRDLCKQELDRGLPSILRIRKGRLQGLGDIEIFSFCELASQTGNNSPYTTMALTFDNALMEWIASRGQVLSLSSSFRGGSIAEQFEAVLKYRIWREHRKTEKVNKRYRENMIQSEDSGTRTSSSFFQPTNFRLRCWNTEAAHAVQQRGNLMRDVRCPRAP